MTIPFTKAHGARNDFLLTWASEAPAERQDSVAVAICDRHTGVGADGWIVVNPAGESRDPAIVLYNSDGSQPELSGNGTRCAAAFLLDRGFTGSEIAILTGAGRKVLRVLEHDGNYFLFDMGMGSPHIVDLQTTISAGGRQWDATLLDVGNPQCAVFVGNFAFDWRSAGAALEGHERFPNRSNVSFVRTVDRHTIDVRFYERGAGETMSSGTGSTGAAAAAVARDLAESPVRVLTPAGPLNARWEGDSIYLTGPAEITARGEFYFPQ